MQEKKAALVLSGGAARGLAHLGVLEVFRREQIPVHMIVGTSMGALIGAIYALDLPLERAKEFARKFRFQRLIDPTIPVLGVAKGERLERIIRSVIDYRGFDDCKIPFAVVSTDIETGEEYAFTFGDLARHIRASSSLPGIFSPVRIDGRLLLDGGIKNTLPVSIARDWGAGFVIAIDVGFYVRQGPVNNVMQVLLQTYQIAGEELSRCQGRDADIVIRPPLDGIDQMAFDKAEEIMVTGKREAERMLPEIKEALLREGITV